MEASRLRCSLVLTCPAFVRSLGALDTPNCMPCHHTTLRPHTLLSIGLQAPCILVTNRYPGRHDTCHMYQKYCWMHPVIRATALETWSHSSPIPTVPCPGSGRCRTPRGGACRRTRACGCRWRPAACTRGRLPGRRRGAGGPAAGGRDGERGLMAYVRYVTEVPILACSWSPGFPATPKYCRHGTVPVAWV